jgi:hypothetical protein
MKRQPTEYNVLLLHPDHPYTMTQVGRVSAYTPAQARSRAAKSISEIKREASKTLYKEIQIAVVPASSMKPTLMRFGPLTKEKKDAGRNPV